MSNNVAPEIISSVKPENIVRGQAKMKEMVSFKVDFGNDILAYQNFLKEKYGVWVSITFSENLEMVFGFDSKALSQIFQD